MKHGCLFLLVVFSIFLAGATFDGSITSEAKQIASIHGNTTACSATELLIDGPGIHCDAGVCTVDAIDADFDVFEGCAEGEGGILVMGGDGEPFPICESSGATDISSMFDLGEGEEAGDVRACVFDFGGAYATVLLPTTWPVDCAGFAEMAELDPPLYDDPDYFTLDPITCTWSYTPDTGLSAAPGWTSPPTISSSGEPSNFAWEVTDDGHGSFASLGINTSLPFNTLMYASETWDSPIIVDGRAPTVLGFMGTANCSTSDCYINGISGSVALYGAGDYSGAYGVSATAAYSGTGTSTYINGLWAIVANYASVTMTGANAAYMEIFVTDDGDITDGTVIFIESPTISTDHTGVITNNRGIWIRDQSCDHNVGDTSRVTNGYGIYIEEFANSASYGLYNLSRSYFGQSAFINDNALLTFGSDNDASIYYDEATKDELIIQFGSSERINIDGTGIGFFGVTPVARASAYTQTYSTSDKTHANMTSTDVTVTPTNSSPWGYSSEGEASSIQTSINALRDDVEDIKQLVNSLIDDMQSYGLAQ